MRLTLQYLLQIAQRLGILLLLYTLLRVAFLWLNWSHFPHVGGAVFLAGIKFDLSAIFITNIPVVLLLLLPIPWRSRRLYQHVVNFVFYISNGFCLMLMCVDLAYFKFTLKHSTVDLFRLMGTGDDLLNLLPAFIVSYWYACVIFITAIVLLILMQRKLRPLILESKFTFRYFLTHLVMGVFVLALGLVVARGGFQLRPLSVINASEFTSPENVPLVLNTPFTMIKSYGKSHLEKREYFKDGNYSEHFSAAKVVRSTRDSIPLNIVLIILESYSKEFIGYYGNKLGLTPFLDSLMSVSLNFTNAYANGRKSIEALPAIIASLPALSREPFVLSPYAGNEITTIPSVLKGLGYHSSFFHGGTNGTMAFDGFCKLADFDAYYGRTEYNKEQDYDGRWGIYDEEFFQYFCEQLNATQPPFFSTFFSLSSHHPYQVPERYVNKLASGPEKIHQTIAYTDMSLRKFFASAKKSAWYANTVFIITADHTPPSSDAYFSGSIGGYKVPLLVFHPSGKYQGTEDRLSQHVDIMPLALSLAGYNDSIITYGQVSGNIASAQYCVNFINEMYQVHDETYLLHFDGENYSALYAYQDDLAMAQNILAKNPEVAVRLGTYLKAVIQDFNGRMVDNKLRLK